MTTPDPSEPDSIEFEVSPHVERSKPAVRTSSSEQQPAVARTAHSGAQAGQTEPPPKALRVGSFALTLAYLPVLAALCWLVLAIGYRVEAGLKFPYQMDAEEGFLFQQALDLMEGRSIYTPVDEEPYLVGNYPPVYPLLVATALRWGSEGLGAGRRLVAISLGGIAVLLLALGWILGRRGVLSVLTPLLFLVTYEVYTWAPYARVDFPALALTLAGITIFLSSRSTAGLMGSALCFVFAAYTRQTALLAPAACVVTLAVHRPRKLFPFLSTYLVPGLGGFVVLNFLLQGELWRHLVVYNRNEMDWNVLWSILRNEIWFFYRWWILGMAVATLSLCVAVVRRRTDDQEGHTGADPPSASSSTFVWTYFVLGALSLSAFAKSGSAANYALEPLASASLLLVYLVSRLERCSRESRPEGRVAARAGLALATLCMILHVGRMLPLEWESLLPGGDAGSSLGRFLDERRVGWALFSSPNPDADETARGDWLVAQIRSQPGEVLAEQPVPLIAAGRPVLFQPFIMTTLAREGQWDAGPMIRDLEQRRFSMILTTEDLRAVDAGRVLARYTPEMARTIVTHYRLSRGLPPGALGIPWFVWTPVGEPD